MSTAFSVEPLSPAKSCFNFRPFEWNRTAVSDEAEQVIADTRQIEDTLEHSQALFGPKEEAIAALWSVAEECGLENWDGYGALPLDPRAVCLAEWFIRAMPDNVPMPETVPEPDGSVGLDWTVSRSRNFTVSFGLSQRLAYAWIDGTDRGYAVARFDGESIPRLILQGIKAITRQFK